MLRILGECGQVLRGVGLFEGLACGYELVGFSGMRGP